MDTRTKQIDPSPSDATLLDQNETGGLIPEHLETQAELNQWEAVNIGDAEHWAFGRRVVGDVLSATMLRDLHRRMFGRTWRWAGTYRTSDKNISPYHWPQVPELMENLVANARTRYEASNKSPEDLDDIALRFHHELVHIHPWPNGNGRHARLATDLLLRSWDRPPFTWGASEIETDAALRARYVAALRHADAGDYSLLMQFVRA